MADHVVVVDVVVPAPPAVIDVASVGVQGPPGATGPAGPAGPAGPEGPAGSGTGDVTGPASATADAIAVFSGTTGKLVRDAVGAAAFGKINSLQAAGYVVANQPGDGRTAVTIGGLPADPNGYAAIWFRNDAIGNSNFAFLGNNNLTIINGPGGGTATLCIGNDQAKGLTVEAGGSLELRELPAPANPAADRARIWLEDNGAGKSRLMIKFATGAAIAIATQA